MYSKAVFFCLQLLQGFQHQTTSKTKLTDFLILKKWDFKDLLESLYHHTQKKSHFLALKNHLLSTLERISPLISNIYSVFTHFL